MKGLSAIIAVLLIMVVSLSLTGGFYFWYSGYSSKITQAAEKNIEQQTTGASADIEIPIVALEGSVYQVVVKNTGKVSLNATTFAVFVDGAPVTAVPADPSVVLLSPQRLMMINISSSLVKCNSIRVTGQYGVTEDYVYNDDGTCFT